MPFEPAALAAHPPPHRRRAAAHQPAGRPRPARRLRAPARQGRPAHGRAGGARGLRRDAAGAAARRRAWASAPAWRLGAALVGGCRVGGLVARRPGGRAAGRGDRPPRPRSGVPSAASTRHRRRSAVSAATAASAAVRCIGGMRRCRRRPPCRRPKRRPRRSRRRGSTMPRLAGRRPRDEATAWRELALHWNVAIGEGDACTAAAQARLMCFRSAGRRPAGGAPSRPARPRGAARRRRGTAALGAAGGPERQRGDAAGRASSAFVLALPALAGAWRGEFATFWRAPAGWREGVDALASPAMRGWVAEQLTPPACPPARRCAQRVPCSSSPRVCRPTAWPGR